jgi:hypothetical protein
LHGPARVDPQQRHRRLQELHAILAPHLVGEHKCFQDAAGNIVFQPQDPVVLAAHAAHAERVREANTLRHIWRGISSGISKTNLEMSLADTNLVTRKGARNLMKKKSKPNCKPIKVENRKDVKGAHVNLTNRIQAMARAKPFPEPVAGQGGVRRSVWVNLAMDGTLRWNKGYIHMTVGATFDPTLELNTWWLLQGGEKWSTLRAVATAIAANEQAARAEGDCTVWTAEGVEEQILLFLLADGKGQVAMAGCAGFNSTKPGACVCHACGKDNAEVKALFGLGSTIAHVGFERGLSAKAILACIPPDRRIPDYGLHGVARVLVCALNGMVRLMQETRVRRGLSNMSLAACRQKLQETLDVARVASGCRTPSEIRGETRNVGLRIETGAALHLMRKKARWAPLIRDIRLKDLDTWFQGFATTCDLVWKKEPFVPEDLDIMLKALKGMGRVHVSLGFKVVLWSHWWIDHMYAYACTWNILSVFSCFRMEGSHRALKARLRNSGGTSKIREKGPNGIMGIVDGDTLDLTLREKGYHTRGKRCRSWYWQPANWEVGGWWEEKREMERQEKRKNNRKKV